MRYARFRRYGHSVRRLLSSVVERVLRKDEVGSSILPEGKTFLFQSPAFLPHLNAQGRRAGDAASNAPFCVPKLDAARKMCALASRVVPIRFLAFHFFGSETSKNVKSCYSSPPRIWALLSRSSWRRAAQPPRAFAFDRIFHAARLS